MPPYNPAPTPAPEDPADSAPESSVETEEEEKEEKEEVEERSSVTEEGGEGEGGADETAAGVERVDEGGDEVTVVENAESVAASPNAGTSQGL